MCYILLLKKLQNMGDYIHLFIRGKKNKVLTEKEIACSNICKWAKIRVQAKKWQKRK